MKNYIFDLYGTLVDIRTDEWSEHIWDKIALYFSAHGAEYKGVDLKESYFAAIQEEQQKQVKKLKKTYPDITEAEVEVSLENKTAVVTVRAGKVDEKALKDAVVAAGFGITE